MKKINYFLFAVIVSIIFNVSAQNITAGAEETFIYNNNVGYQMGGTQFGNPLQNLALPNNSSGVKKITSTLNVTYVLFNDGLLYAKGSARFGNLGRGFLNNNIYSNFERPISPILPNTLLAGVEDVSASNGSVLILYQTGEVLHLGLKGTDSYNASPNFVNESFTSKLNNIVKIEAGWTANYAIDSNGAVWTWGFNTYGQLGNNQPDTQRAVLMSGLSNVVDIKASFYHTLFLHANGEVSAMGQNFNGKLGIGQNYGNINIPMKVKTYDTSGFLVNLSDVIDIDVSTNSSYFLLNTGNVLSVGGQSSGSLGQPLVSSGSQIDTPDYVVNESNSGILSGIIDIEVSLGNYVIAKRSDCDIVAWGYSGFSAFGIQNTNAQTIPVPFDISFISNCLAPVINYQATNYTICENSCTEFTATQVSGQPVNSIDWLMVGAVNKNGSGLVEEACYTTAGTYDVEISIDGGPFQSSGITITVLPSTDKNCQGVGQGSSSGSNQKVLLYPNPAQSHFELKLENYEGELSEVKVYDGHGRLVKHFKQKASKYDINNLNDGFYSVEIMLENKEKLFTELLIKS